MKAVSIGHQMFLRSTENKIGMLKTTLHRALQTELILWPSSSVKPICTDNNKLDRMKFAVDHVDYNSSKDTLEFKNMFDYEHVDKEWLLIMKKHQSFYLA